MQPKAARRRAWACYNNQLVDNHRCIIVGVQATGARLSEESRAAEAMIARFTQGQGKNPQSISAHAHGAFRTPRG